MNKPGNVLFCNAAWQLFWQHLCTHSRTPAHIKGSVASLRNTRVGTAPASCIPGVAVLAVLACVVQHDPLKAVCKSGTILVYGGGDFPHFSKHGSTPKPFKNIMRPYPGIAPCHYSTGIHSGSSPFSHLTRMLVRVRIGVRVIPFSHSRQVRKWTRPYTLVPDMTYNVFGGTLNLTLSVSILTLTLTRGLILDNAHQAGSGKMRICGSSKW